ncbi:MAG: hypothetical protein M9927_20165 [Anaerolineae bacterium]|nr:hypothetical protein [Anaerolineae bacterium]
MPWPWRDVLEQFDARLSSAWRRSATLTGAAACQALGMQIAAPTRRVQLRAPEEKHFLVLDN